MKTSYKRLGLIVTAILAAIGFAAWFGLFNLGVVPLAANDVKSVEIDRIDYDPQSRILPQEVVISEEKEAIAALMQVVQSARETSDHKCGSRGTITLKTATGASTKLQYLAGHDEQFYEFRYNQKIYIVSRDKFVEVMQKLGVKVPLKC